MAEEARESMFLEASLSPMSSSYSSATGLDGADAEKGPLPGVWANSGSAMAGLDSVGFPRGGMTNDDAPASRRWGFGESDTGGTGIPIIPYPGIPIIPEGGIREGMEYWGKPPPP